MGVNSTKSGLTLEEFPITQTEVKATMSTIGDWVLEPASNPLNLSMCIKPLAFTAIAVIKIPYMLYGRSLSNWELHCRLYGPDLPQDWCWVDTEAPWFPSCPPWHPFS